MSEEYDPRDDAPGRMMSSPSFEGGSGTHATVHNDNYENNMNSNNNDSSSRMSVVSAADESMLSSSSQQQLPFFADAILDLEEAHDIADTPEATRPRFDPTSKFLNTNRHLLQVPSLKLTTQQQQQRTRGVLPENAMQSSIDHRQHPELVKRTSGLKSNMGVNHNGTIVDNNMTSSGGTEHAFRGIGIDDDDARIPDHHEKDNFSRITNLETDLRSAPPPIRPPRWPRDIPWTVAFILYVPFSLIYPITLEKHEVHLSPLTRHPLSTATIHALWWTTLATVLLCRLLYRSRGGAEGDDARQVAAMTLTLAAPISVVVYLTLAFILYWSCPHARWATLIPLWYTVRDVFLFRRWKRRVNNQGGGGQTAGYASRQAFFQALVCMALDILARSLRRESFYRVLTAILLVQLGVLALWRWALIGALGSGSWFILLVAFVGGKWATGTVARTLTLLASGGVMSWCFQQAASLDEMSGHGDHSSNHRRNSSNQYQLDEDVYDNDDGIMETTTTTTAGQSENDYNPNENGTSYAADSRVPEAYRTVDASVYHSVLAMDDVLDDDYEDDDDGDLEAPAFNRRLDFNSSSSSRPAPTTSSAAPTTSRSTVKAILLTGLVVSFGSIAHCGLLGGLAQFVWSQLRKVTAAQTALSQRRRTSTRRDGTSDGTNGFQVMEIGDDTNKFVVVLWRRIHLVLRDFVRSHSDLAMTHVASYYKGYTKSARDVAILIDESGKEVTVNDSLTVII